MAKKVKDTTLYSLKDAIAKVKQTSKSKFDAAVEMHINLAIDPKTQGIRFITSLPHGTGKTKKVAVLASKKVPNADLELSESDLDKIEKGSIKPKVDFEVLIAEPRYMPKIAKVARVLGPAGMMPNPKTGTVTEEVEKAVEEIKKGKVVIKTEKDAPLMHTVIGRVSFDDVKLSENFAEVLSNLKQNKPAKAKPEWINSVYLTSTMGPSVNVAFNS